MHFATDDLRIQSLRPLLPPAILMEELPLGDRGSEVVAHGRETVARILRGEDDRLVVVAGPCSIHDPDAALDYARRLRKVADEHCEGAVRRHARLLREAAHDRSAGRA